MHNLIYMWCTCTHSGCIQHWWVWHEKELQMCFIKPIIFLCEMLLQECWIWLVWYVHVPDLAGLVPDLAGLASLVSAGLLWA